jgi:hypothetical protein
MIILKNILASIPFSYRFFRGCNGSVFYKITQALRYRKIYVYHMNEKDREMKESLQLIEKR